MVHWKDLKNVRVEDIVVSNLATLRVFSFEADDPGDKEIRWEHFLPHAGGYSPDDAKCKIFDAVMNEVFIDIDSNTTGILITPINKAPYDLAIVNVVLDIKSILDKLGTSVELLINGKYFDVEEDELQYFFYNQGTLNDSTEFAEALIDYLEIQLVPHISSHVTTSSKGGKILGEEFHEFLKANNCLIKFCAALAAQENVSLNHYIKCGIHKKSIQYAFEWMETKEGDKFWEEIDMKWRDHYKELMSANKTNKEIRTMKTLRNTIGTSIALGKEAAKIAIDIEKGTLGLTLIKDQLTDFLPEKANALLNTTEGTYMLAHVVAAILEATKPVHKLYGVADDISRCVVTAASTKELGKFNLPAKISGLAAAMGINAGTAVDLIKTKTKGKKEEK